MLELDLDTRQIGQGIYNYVVAGLRDLVQQWADQAANLVLDNWRDAASGTIFPGMTKAFHSDAYRLGLERGGVTFDGETASVVVGAQEETTIGPGRAFNLHRMIEYGRPAYNMRDAWLAGGATGARTNKSGGRFIIIPFRHGAGESVHFPMNLSRQVRRMARTGPVTERRYARTRNPWDSAATRATPHGPSVALGLGPRHIKQGLTDAYTWKRAILAGVRRYGGGRQSRYMTFRTMSESSDPNAWVMPALPANPIAMAVRDASAAEMRRRIRTTMEQMAPAGVRA